MTRLSPRPQPLGVLPLPAGYLVVPPVPGAEAFAAALCAGQTPAAPPGLGFYALALAGDADAALAALAADDSPEAAYNRLVLGGDQAGYGPLRAALTGELALLLDVLAYTLGWIDAPPDPGAAAGELAACALSARAAYALERGQPAQAAAALEAASEAARPVSPLLAAQLLGDLAEIEAAHGAGRRAVQRYREALDLVPAGGPPGLRAQLAMRLGMLFQNLADGRREWLLEAAKCYQEALKHFTRESHPELFALAQNNLALAYLAMPLTEASDQLRMGVAVQSLREALTIYTQAAYPEHWASAQLNLANALQYLPSRNPEDHLAEAVELYEELLAARSRAADPLGYARVLANQGNALAHLGIFAHARPKLAEAMRLFAAAGDRDAAAAVGAALDEIAEREALKQQGQPDGAVPAPAV
jgi:tetratricopeptide (TPR) repeat protein